jgi:cyclic pyranopterin phosphate synthase
MEEKQFSIEDFVQYSDSKKFIIYTDGSCIPNPGPGGWAYEIRDQDENKIIDSSGADKNTTNNRMELTAVIKAFEDDVIPINSNVVIKSDSQLIINTMTKNWKKKENIELWDQLSNIIIKKNLKCDWEWVKAHAGIEGNENVDKKANAQARMTHLSSNGDVNMVDVSDKKKTIRIAKATSKVIMSEEAFHMVQNNNSKKGNVTATARIAGIQAAKKTHELIPLCHQINLTKVEIDFELDVSLNSISIFSEVKCNSSTGVEMEALTAVSVASLTIYDMLKSVDKKILINEIHLISKSGGESGDFKF